METTLQKSSAFPPQQVHSLLSAQAIRDLKVLFVSRPSNTKSWDKQGCKTTTPVHVITRNTPGRWLYIPVIPQKAPLSLRNIPIRCRSNLFNLIFAYPCFTSKSQVQLPASWGVVHTDLCVKHKLGNWCGIWPVAFVNNLLINHLCHFSSASPLWMQEHLANHGELKWWCGLRRVSPFSTWEQRSTWGCVINAQEMGAAGIFPAADNSSPHTKPAPTVILSSQGCPPMAGLQCGRGATVLLCWVDGNDRGKWAHLWLRMACVLGGGITTHKPSGRKFPSCKCWNWTTLIITGAA